MVGGRWARFGHRLRGKGTRQACVHSDQVVCTCSWARGVDRASARSRRASPCSRFGFGRVRRASIAANLSPRDLYFRCRKVLIRTNPATMHRFRVSSSAVTRYSRRGTQRPQHGSSRLFRPQRTLVRVSRDWWQTWGWTQQSPPQIHADVSLCTSRHRVA